MTKDLFYPHYDLVTPDGVIQELSSLSGGELSATLEMRDIPSTFRGLL